MIYDITERVREAHEYFDKILDENLLEIEERSGVPAESLVKINPADFAVKNRWQSISGYKYQKIAEFIEENKNDHTFLISPEDAVRETAAQISYKEATEIRRTIRASKCEVVPCPKELALDFFVRNHRQTLPNVRGGYVSYCLLFKNEVVAVMLYDRQPGAVRGSNDHYELLRLSISRGTRVHGGASKLQKACEETLREMGVTEIYSYSNATINNGAVYEKLGFTSGKISEGQPFVIMEDNRIVRLIELFPNSTDRELAKRGRIKTHLGGNKTWWKNISEEVTQSNF